MITKFYKWMAAGTVTSLLLATLAVAPVAAQSSSENGQSSDQSQGQEMNQDQGMNQDNNQNGNNGQNGNGQNQGQGSCVAFAQSMGQGMSQGNNQNGNNGQATLGTGPGNAATPMANCWLSIGPGQKQWYKFHVGARSNKGDENNNFDNANGVDDSDAAIAELTMDTQGCIAFEIWTQERLTAAQNGVKDDDKLLGPVGAGSPEFVINKNNDNSSDNSSSNNNSSSANSDKNLNRGRLLWRGGSTVREDFLLVVRNLRSDSTCSYRLSVAGPTVSFPGANNGNNNANGSNNGNSGNNNNGNNGNNNNGSNNGSSNGNNNNG